MAQENGQAGTPCEIEITPEMIEAGADVIFEWRDCADAYELARRVYTAMARPQHLGCAPSEAEDLGVWNRRREDVNVELAGTEGGGLCIAFWGVTDRTGG